MEYIAGSDVQQLGLSFSTLPPDSLIIKRVRQGTWAEAHGIEAGDMVVAVDGLDVHKLTSDKFKLLMQERPLTLLIDSLAVRQEDGAHVPTSMRSTLFDPDLWWWASEDGVDEKASALNGVLQPEQKSLEFQSIAQQQCFHGFSMPFFCIEPDDKHALPCMDGLLKQEMSQYDANVATNTDQDKDTDEGADDVTDSDTDDDANIISHADDVTRACTAEYVVGPEVTRLGLAFSTLPPDPLIVKRVTKGTWADLQGMNPGDMIVAVNGLDVKKLTGEEFKCIVQERPLVLRIDSLMEELRFPACSRTTVFDIDSCSGLDWLK
mmetsp:Transcript_44705/g.78695  ORF Transcript_44705/g.78695 Transcript_44705/m.78695 type:complete len:321 (+) Transcript_44705:68-1030(+)